MYHSVSKFLDFKVPQIHRDSIIMFSLQLWMNLDEDAYPICMNISALVSLSSRLGIKNVRNSCRGLHKGKDQGYNLVLNLKQAIFGVEKEIKVTRLESCGPCNKSSVKPGTSAPKCTCSDQIQIVFTSVYAILDLNICRIYTLL
ncbi:hypothetical protein HanHA300_Chr04g0130031 [Helianthus annuus]|nr:hypothetical protein HanHA300_Chr04g0130031 [Helianthus annuus]KAJ0596467.1 hypothetical protein HanHA89_Chr04g0143081 [Helianthus annuus]KAJ0757126.1 hypothetical protein HanLR1_Chr04g0134991 [Helianthus annuus]KAJ0760851.1 hypothetical protein HanOQP8_Chr04g0142771 [Helianthus annuus]